MSSSNSPPSPRSQPFLSQEQREALDAALAEKQDKNKLHKQDRRWMVHRRSHSKEFYEKTERKSRSGKGTGAPKKGGAGGKFTWGDLLDNGDNYYVDRLDPSDPNYDSEDEKQVFHKSIILVELDQYKEQVTSIILEYFDNGDINETANLLEALGLPHFAHYFVKKAITLAMDRRDREREMTSVLLSVLYNEVLMPEQLRKGFISIIKTIDDLKLDVPEAPELLSLFIARAIIDDILPPSIMTKIPCDEGSAIDDIRDRVNNHLSARHCTERLLRCWGSGAGLNYQDTQESIIKILFEYTSSHDIEEARRCLRTLDIKFFHHEFVKQAVHMAMDNMMHRGAFIELLATLSNDGEITDSQMQKGFNRVASRLDDTILDNPSAMEQFTEVVDMALKENLVSSDANGLIKEATATTSEPGIITSHPHSIMSFKTTMKNAIREYFESSDIDEVAYTLSEQGDPGLHHIFVKHSIQMAMDRRDREREMISVLLSTLYPHILSGDQLAQGFTRSLLSIEDLILDNPNAGHQLTCFLGRIIVDDVLPPSFLTSVLGTLKDDSLGVQIVKETGLILSARHASERFLNCWHGGSKDTNQIQQDIKIMLKEYLISKDIKEVSRCLRELSMPFYHHELVRRAIEMALDNDTVLSDIELLLSSLAKQGEINDTQMKKGFDRMEALLDDLALDYPRAKEQFQKIKNKATKECWTELMVPECKIEGDNGKTVLTTETTSKTKMAVSESEDIIQ